MATPIGNLGDITRRAVETLGSVDEIVAEDTRRTRQLLSHLGLSTRLSAYHQHNEAAATPAIVERLQSGHDIAVVSDAGTPAVSDPGERLVAAAIETGIEVVPVPGASAVLAALVASGLDASRFTFLGYPPRKRGELERFFGSISEDPATMIILESPRRVTSTLAAAAEILGADRRACVAREITKMHEEFIRGTLAELRERFTEPAKGEITVVIEGASETAPEPLDDAEIRQRYATLLAEGLSATEARRLLVETTGMRRRDVYRAIHLADSSKTET